MTALTSDTAGSGKTEPARKGVAEPIAALNRIKIIESGEPLIDIRLFCPGVHVLERVCPYLRKTAAEMLNTAAASLPSGYRFRIGTALRTLSMQRKGWDRFFRQQKTLHPDWPLSSLRRATNKYYAPYDEPAPPGHCTGGAVDVILLGPKGRPADVTSPLDRWSAADTWTDQISPAAKANRMVMVEAMLAAGFSNCRDEFWHYSYGDSAWAVRVGLEECPYGWAYAPVAVEAAFKGGRAGRIEQVGEATWVCMPAMGPRGHELSVGVFWSNGKAITIRFPAPESPPLESVRTVMLSRDRKRWRALTATADSSIPSVTFIPTEDRVYLAYSSQK